MLRGCGKPVCGAAGRQHLQHVRRKQAAMCDLRKAEASWIRQQTDASRRRALIYSPMSVLYNIVLANVAKMLAGSLVESKLAT